MKGWFLDFEGVLGDNNVFVMRIGVYVVIEFGVIGYVFYLFCWDVLLLVVFRVLILGKVKDYVVFS